MVYTLNVKGKSGTNANFLYFNTVSSPYPLSDGTPSSSTGQQEWDWLKILIFLEKKGNWAGWLTGLMGFPVKPEMSMLHRIFQALLYLFFFFFHHSVTTVQILHSFAGFH